VGFFSTKRIIFIASFAVVAFIGSQINFSQILGANSQYFTLFQFFGPITGAFLGPWVGALAILFSEIGNFLLLGKEFTIINLFRLAPMLFAAFYFGSSLRKKVNVIAIVPLIAMGAFMLHPIGQQVWYYSLFWLIPIGMKLLFPKRLFARSLGATFTAHSIGSTIWIWTIPSTALLWNALIPIVAVERTLFALGIMASYLLFNTALSKMEAHLPDISRFVNTNPRYVLSKNLLRLRA